MDNLAPILYAVTFAFVLLFSLFLMALGGVSFLAPAKAKAFLLGFAASSFTHYLEMALRLVVGGSILFQAPLLTYPGAFTIFGWMLVGTSAVLLLLPWKWHRHFAEKAVPPVLSYIALVGVVSLGLGVVLLIFLLNSLPDG
ncbi:MAG: hypothetical protein ABL984_21425 [Pyrinomonadaceae bacterium]